MRNILICTAFFAAMAAPALAQKGVDPQTQKIKDDTAPSKTLQRENDATRSFDWGKGKTKVRDPLPNPYRVSARRDALIEIVTQALQERHILMDEKASRLKDGIIITQPFVFAKGPVTTKGEMIRYGQVEYTDTAWSRGQFTLTIEVQPIDGTNNNVLVNAKVEGLSGDGLTSEWRSVPSSGLAEDDFLAKLVELLTGKSPDDKPEPKK